MCKDVSRGRWNTTNIYSARFIGYTVLKTIKKRRNAMWTVRNFPFINKHWPSEHTRRLPKSLILVTRAFDPRSPFRPTHWRFLTNSVTVPQEKPRSLLSTLVIARLNSHFVCRWAKENESLKSSRCQLHSSAVTELAVRYRHVCADHVKYS
jgi:hypothetical protein